MVNKKHQRVRYKERARKISERMIQIGDYTLGPKWEKRLNAEWKQYEDAQDKQRLCAPKCKFHYSDNDILLVSRKRSHSLFSTEYILQLVGGIQVRIAQQHYFFHKDGEYHIAGNLECPHCQNIGVSYSFRTFKLLDFD